MRAIPIRRDRAAVRRALLGVVTAATVLAGVTATPAASHPHGPSNDEYTFIGGGWGHGTGLSQFGALGRAESGFSYDEILAFYYDSTELTTDSSLVPDDVDVLLGVHNTTVFRPSGQLTVAMDGSFLDTTVRTLTVRRGDGGWHINSSNIDWCQGFCTGTRLTVSFVDSEPVAVSGTVNGADQFAHGQFQLTPASSGVADCGNRSRNQYCLVVGEMTMQQYLAGINEMPFSWPQDALKAQAVAARSYAAAIMKERSDRSAPFDLHASTRDQTYTGWDAESDPAHGAWASAVRDTDDTVLTFYDSETGEHEVIVAYYSSSNGGHTAANEEPRRDPLPYLLAKPDPYDAAWNEFSEPANPYFLWERTYTAEQISQWLADYPFGDLDVGDIVEIYISNPGPSGRIDDALVTLVGSQRTLEVRDEQDDPYGYRFYFALVLGCRETPDCDVLRSTKFMLNNDHGDFGSESGSSGGSGGSAGSGGTTGPQPFTDVPRGAPYAAAVQWMRDSGITTGTSPTTFSPERSLTRAQFATFLWRFAGEPFAGNASGTFVDVESNRYYSEAVEWMAAEGLTSGCGTNPARFCPHDDLKASHLAAFAWRFAGRTYSNHAIPFDDIGINAHYLEAARWMVEHDLWVDEDHRSASSITNRFAPFEPLSRSRMAEIMWRLADAPDAFHRNVSLPPLMR